MGLALGLSLSLHPSLGSQDHLVVTSISTVVRNEHPELHMCHQTHLGILPDLSAPLLGILFLIKKAVFI